MSQFKNAPDTGEIPSFNGSEEARATDFANYFCSYSQIFHQKQMLSDTSRMAAYHSAILSNPDVFKDKVVMDVGTGSGILACWAAQAGARKVYAIEYTDMANNARAVMEANNVSHIVTVVQGAVESVDLPEDVIGGVDIIISEWMGYFLLRESMLDSLIRARDKYLRPKTGLMFPSHCTMYFAPIMDEEDRQASNHEYSNSMSDWYEFAESTASTYGVNMKCLEKNYEKEQREYYLLSSKWSELPDEAVIAEPVVVKTLDMATCTLHESKGILPGASAPFKFNIEGEQGKVCSGFAGWFTSDFKSRTDDEGKDAAPKLTNPVLLSTGPENGYTHWGQQVFHLTSPITCINGEETVIEGDLEMMRSKDNVRLYQCKMNYVHERKNKTSGVVLNKSKPTEIVYMMP
jgi:protein arginine N-methyltransferase 1